MADDKLRYDDLANLDPQFWKKAIADMNKFFVAAKQGFKDIKEEATETKKSLSTLSVSNPKQAAEISRLNDRVKELDRLLKGLSSEAKTVNAAKKKFIELSKQEQIALERTAQSTKKQRLEAREAVRVQNSQAGSLERMSVNLSKANRALRLLTVGSEAYKKKIKEVRIEQDRYNKELAKAGNSRGFVGNYQRALQGLTAQFSALGAAYAAVRVAQSAFATVKEVDRINNALKSITDSAEELNRIQGFLSGSAEAYGIELNSLSLSYVQFAAATKGTNLQGEQTLKIFDSVSKSAANMGLSIEETNGVLRALGQIVSKSKVQAEELRGQLGDRLSGAFKIFADSIGLSTSELDKLLKKGGVLADETLPKFAEGLEKAYGVENLKRIETIVAEQNRLTNSWTEYITAVENSSNIFSKVFGGISRGLSSILKQSTATITASTNLAKFLTLEDRARVGSTAALGLLDIQKEFDVIEKQINKTASTSDRLKLTEDAIFKLLDAQSKLNKETEIGTLTNRFYEHQINLLNKAFITSRNNEIEEAKRRAKIAEETGTAVELAAQKERLNALEKERIRREKALRAKIAEIRASKTVEEEELPQIDSEDLFPDKEEISEEAKKFEKDFGDILVEAAENISDKAGAAFELEEFRKRKAKEQRDNMIQFGKQIADAYIDGLNSRLAFRQDFLARSLAIENDVLAAQLRLIKDGGEANLAATKENQRKLEAERLKSLKRQERLAKLQLLLNLLVAATQAGSNLSQAKGSALTQIKGVAGVGATFGEGGIGHEVFKEQNAISTRGRKQNREGRLVDGIFKGDSHKSKSGGILARVEGDEGIFTTKAMKNLGADTFHSMHNHLNGGHDLSTFLAQEAKVLPVIAQVNNSKELNVIAAKLDSVESTIANKPVQHISQEVIGNIAVLVNRQTRGNMTKTIKSSGGSLHG